MHPDWRHVQSGQQPGLDVENHWKDIKDAKWGKIEKHLDKALSSSTASVIWFVTYTSASRVPDLGYFPGDYAAYLLPKVRDDIYTNFITQPQDPWGAYFGTVLMDFPTREIISLMVRAAMKYQYAHPVPVVSS